MKKLELLLLLLTITTSAVADVTWSDITSRFIQNPNFNNGNCDGWTVSSNAGQKAVSAQLMRFYDGTFDFSQQLTGLPKGHYRLSVQGFYRHETDCYQARQDGTERLTAFLFAGDAKTPLVSVYSEAMTTAAGNRQLHDGRYYPDNSTSAAAAFEEGLYKGNSVEFDAQGSVAIGVMCQEAGSGNYCAFDNFKLEYAGAGGKVWIDVTDAYLTNARLVGDNSGWTWVSNANSQAFDYDCMEFWNGTFDIWQTVRLPQGHYRLSVQAFYRCKDNFDNSNPGWGDYFDYQNGTQNITGYMYAGDTQQKLVSVYSEPRPASVGNWVRFGQNYYPDGMNSASVYFSEGRYWNTMEFDASGQINVGLRCQENERSNWCIFDNFRLETYTDMVNISSISVSMPTTQLVIGESVTASAAIQPATATLPFVDWSTSNPLVATVDRNGLVTAVGKGTATITATAGDGSGVTGTIIITVDHNPAGAGSFIINEIMASNIDEFISPAFNFDGWVELYNPTNRSVELGGVVVSDPADAANKWTLPQTAGVVPAKGYKLVWFESNDGNPNNAPFKLDTDGGVVTFSTAGGQVIATQQYPASLERISYARAADGTGNWGMTATATPGATNNGIKHLTTQLDAPVVDQASQLFTGELSLNVTIPAGCTLRYTTDGTLPTLTNGETSQSGRFTVTNTECFRFRLFASDKLPSRVTTRTYLQRDRNYYLPVISVVTDPAFLYSSEIGVMAKGPNGRPGRGQDDNCNWNMDWERPANFSYLAADGVMGINQDVNLEMCGGWSRAWTPHSFKLKGNKEMGGDKNLVYPFFEQKPYIRNRTLQIRNGGNDTQGRFIDPSLQVILSSSGLDVDYQSYQPVHEFINGQYVGLLNMREPNNKHYVYANYGWDDDVIDQFEMSPDSGYIQNCGTPDAFLELVDVLSPNAANPQTYEEIGRVLDIDAYINYMAALLYLGGTDFPQNNVKGFRHRDNGRFRFVVFDLDHAFGSQNPFELFFSKEMYTFDPLKPASLGRIHDRIAFVTLFRNMLQNAGFRRRFIDAFCIMGGSVFEAERSAAIIDELVNNVLPANGAAWNSSVTVRQNLNSRMNISSNALASWSAFGVSSSASQWVILGSDTEGAKLYINEQVVPTGSFNGILFPPVVLRAEAPAGYAFSGWVDESGKTFDVRQEVALPNGSVILTATFRKLSAEERTTQGITPVRVNEVSGANDSFIDEYGKKGDWVELYNTTDEPIDVEGMYLSDNAQKPTKYRISKDGTQVNTVIPAHGYLVVWCDNKRETSDGGLHSGFKIADDGGIVMLTAADQRWSDVLTYEAHDARTTVGRYPDGSAQVYAVNVATIGKSNVKTSYATQVAQDNTSSVENLIATSGDLRLVYGADALLVKCSLNGAATIQVYRADGVPVLERTLQVEGGTAQLSVSELPTGFYVARVTTANGAKASCRFVK